jgi:serine/threonine protein phosphatase PrpC
LENNVRQEILKTDDAKLPERLARAFLITDMQSRQLDRNTAGATAVVALIRGIMKPSATEPTTQIRERTLYIGNVGDSRAVLVCKKQLDGV